ncbi:MAG: histidine triad nucleotide-binding protein [Clostridiales bacterium]
MSECIFCKIINKEIPAKIVYEDNKVIAFNDINPVASIHILFLPKLHIKNINCLNETNYSYIINIHQAIQKVAIKLNINEQGYRVISNCGKGAGQTVFHLHYHLLSGNSLDPKII